MKQLKIATRLFLVMTLLLGVVYPLIVTAISQLVLNYQANGSLMKVNSEIIGSELLAQKFTSDQYFWPRPSAVDYHAESSGASNFSLTHPELKKQFDARLLEMKQKNKQENIPADLLFASGSGLDPHISIEAALVQAARVSEARHLDLQKVQSLIKTIQQERQFGFLGEARVNVLVLNTELDKLH